MTTRRLSTLILTGLLATPIGCTEPAAPASTATPASSVGVGGTGGAGGVQTSVTGGFGGASTGGHGGRGGAGGGGVGDTSLFGMNVVATVSHEVPNGIVVGGYVVDDGTGVGDDLFVGKVDAQGMVVTSFGVDGVVRLDLGGSQPAFNEAVMAIDVAADGTIVVAGAARAVDPATTNGPLFVLKLDPNGVADPSFADSGVYQVDYGTEAGVRGLTIDDTGRVLLAGYHDVGGDDFLVARLLSDGAVDTTFGSFGTPGRMLLPGTHKAAAVFCDEDDLVVGGFQDFVITKVSANGTPISAFGSNGRNQYSGGGRAAQMIATADGKYVMAGSEDVPEPRTVLVGYDANGQLDPLFGTDGVVRFPVVALADAIPIGLAERQGFVYVMLEPGKVGRVSLAGDVDLTFGNMGPINPVAPGFTAVDGREVGRLQLTAMPGGIGLVGRDGVSGSAAFAFLSL